MNAKFIALSAVVDDTFDMYGTYEDCKLLNDAIQRQVIKFTTDIYVFFTNRSF